MTTGPALLLATAVSASIATIVADLKECFVPARIFRPTAMAAIILLAAARPAATSGSYRLFITAGLAASLVGDVFMMLPKKKFAAGLVAFFVAHCFYATAFLRAGTARVEITTALPFLLCAFFMMRTLYPRLGALKAPVTLYILAMTAMAVLAAQRYITAGGAPAFSAFAGAMIFIASDVILSVNRFLKKIPLAQLYILGTYFTAQILFALSV
ncbi:MAG: lysoplasmalogenase [Candidatus Aminicenantes bacterium]|nr:lysoplasmalogenase [Candidatus Aminicenantes bacterium]